MLVIHEISMKYAINFDPFIIDREIFEVELVKDPSCPNGPALYGDGATVKTRRKRIYVLQATIIN